MKYYLLLSFFFVQTITAYSQVVTDGLVAYYPLDGNAQNTVENANHGEVYGAVPTTNRFGDAGSAYYFDGNSIIAVEDCVGLDNNNFTLSWWAQFEELPSDQNSMVMIDFGTSPFGGGFYGHVSSVNNNYSNTTGWRTTSGNTDGTSIGFQNDVLPDPSRWYHLTLLRSDDSVKFYVDCKLLLGKPTDGKLPMYNTPNRLYFGSRIQSSLPQKLKGKMDNVAVYNRVLTEDEINRLCYEGICRQYITVTDTLLINTGMSGYDPVTFSNTIKIYPNPAKTAITVDAGDIDQISGYSYKIFNTLGTVVYENVFTDQPTSIMLSNWGGAGTYFFQVMDEHGHITDIRKIVIQ